MENLKNELSLTLARNKDLGRRVQQAEANLKVKSQKLTKVLEQRTTERATAQRNAERAQMTKTRTDPLAH